MKELFHNLNYSTHCYAMIMSLFIFLCLSIIITSNLNLDFINGHLALGLGIILLISNLILFKIICKQKLSKILKHLQAFNTLCILMISLFWFTKLNINFIFFIFIIFFLFNSYSKTKTKFFK